MNWWARFLFAFLTLTMVFVLTATHSWFLLAITAVYGLLIAGADLRRRAK